MKPPGRQNDKRSTLDFFIPALTLRELLELPASHLVYIFCPNDRHLVYPFFKSISNHPMLHDVKPDGLEDNEGVNPSAVSPPILEVLVAPEEATARLEYVLLGIAVLPKDAHPPNRWFVPVFRPRRPEHPARLYFEWFLHGLRGFLQKGDGSRLPQAMSASYPTTLLLEIFGIHRGGKTTTLRSEISFPQMLLHPFTSEIVSLQSMQRMVISGLSLGSTMLITVVVTMVSPGWATFRALLKAQNDRNHALVQPKRNRSRM